MNFPSKVLVVYSDPHTVAQACVPTTEYCKSIVNIGLQKSSVHFTLRLGQDLGYWSLCLFAWALGNRGKVNS
jgi:hypothetical protein